MVLGLAGLLPLAGAIGLQVAHRNSGIVGPSLFMIVMSALGYAALILSFLGGMWWSAACNRLHGAILWRWLGVAVLPSLWAAASFFAGLPRGTAFALAGGLLLSLVADRAAMSTGLVPRWWMWLRVPLSCGLAAEVLAVGWLA